MNFITNGYKRFSSTNSPGPRQHAPLSLHHTLALINKELGALSKQEVCTLRGSRTAIIYLRKSS